MTIDQRHILLRERKVLAARLVQIEAALPLESTFRRSAADLAYANLDKKPREIFRERRMQLDSDEIQLDTALNTFLSRLQHFAKADLDDKPVLFDELKSALNVRAAAMACESCSKLAPQVCNGSAVDDQIVNAGAACLAPLDEMFQIAYEIAHHYYLTYSTSLNGQIPVIFGTENFSQGKADDRPHDLPVKYFVSGKTMYLDAPGQMLTKVVLKIPVRAFDTNTYLSTLYILFHECIVHAFHAITSPTPRRGTKDEDRFLEGWMDWISFEILDKVLNGHWPLARPQTLKFLQERLDRATRFHQARIDIETENESEIFSPLASNRATGRRAAIKVRNLFANRPQCADPWEKLLQMSFDLNMMSTFDERKRESFVSMLDFLDDDDKAPDLPYEHCAVAGLLTNYLQNNNLQALVDSVVWLESQWL